jgi:hypothetical protein
MIAIFPRRSEMNRRSADTEVRRFTVMSFCTRMHARAAPFSFRQEIRAHLIEFFSISGGPAPIRVFAQREGFAPCGIGKFFLNELSPYAQLGHAQIVLAPEIVPR